VSSSSNNFSGLALIDEDLNDLFFQGADSKNVIKAYDDKQHTCVPKKRVNKLQD